MASIRKLPSGNYQAAVLLDDGKRATKAFPKRAEAIKWAADLEEEREKMRLAKKAAADRPVWTPPSTPAGSVEEVAERILIGAAAIKNQLVEMANNGVVDVIRIFANEQVLWALDLGYQVATGQRLPGEFQLGPEEHFGPDGKVFSD